MKKLLPLLLFSFCFLTYAKNTIQLDPRDYKTLFKIFKANLPENPIIVEAGAYDGTDTKRMSILWPKGVIHAFEPVPEVYEKLLKKTYKIPNIKSYKAALSNKNGTAIFYNSSLTQSPHTPYASGSLLEPKEHLNVAPHVAFNSTINVETYTLDTWAKKNNIKKIDGLWLDMQGFALDMLKASPHILKTVKLIYVEVELIEAYKGQPLYPEVKKWIQSQGFTLIAKDFKRNKKRWFGNALFVRKN